MKEYLQDISFADPWFFLLLALVPLIIWYEIKRRRRKYVALTMSTLDVFPRNAKPGRVRFLPLLLILRVLAFTAFVIAIARPQTGFSNQRVSSRGIDIMLALDISSSMYAADFHPNRITAAKEAAKQFIDERPSDRIGVVVFAGEAFTLCPATLDHALLKKQIDNADNWQLEDGTAIGNGLFMAINRLVDTTHLTTKVIILLTDGVQNRGNYSPVDAANAAKQLNIRVYSIGVGTNSNRPIPILDKNGNMISELDPRNSFDRETLKQIADVTGGEYFTANSREKLKEVYNEIDKIEKQKLEVDITTRYDEKFYPFALAGIILLLTELILANTVFRTLT